jgi:tetratricopeptide (TPR) repeat protein
VPGPPGKHALALPLYEKALRIRQKVLGEEHPATASSYNNLAGCLNDQGNYVLALPLCEKALAIRKKTLGEEHPDTAASYNNVAGCLNELGKQALALPLYDRALAIIKKMLGEEHPYTATCCSNVAMCLSAQGKQAQALPLLEKALAITRKRLGEEHPDTAARYNNVAYCLDALGQQAQAQPLYQKALVIWKNALGEEHPHTADGYSNVAMCLATQGKHTLALPQYERALLIRRKVFGEQHPHTAISYNNVAGCLDDQGKHDLALPLHEKALAIWKKALGDEHPNTATSYVNLTGCLWRQGRAAQGLRLLQASLPGQEAARFHLAASGFDRALARSRLVSPHELLAVGLARLGQPRNAFRHAEASLARGLLDDLAAPAEQSHLASLSAHLKTLDDKLLPLYGKSSLSKDQKRLRDEINRQRRGVLAEKSRLAGAVSARQVLPLWRIQKQIPDDSALVFWLDAHVVDEHWACILRSEGPPVWVPLPGSGKGGSWTNDDRNLARRLVFSLRSPGGSGERDRLIAAVAGQRLAPLRRHLKGVQQLLVVPTGGMALVPVEVLTAEYSVACVPSGSVYARLREKQRPLAGFPVLALGDPLFSEPSGQQPAPPRYGLLIKAVLPSSTAGRAGLRPGDVLLRYNGRRLEHLADLQLRQAGQVDAVCWRHGKELSIRLAAGSLGASFDERSAAAAVRAWRQLELSVVKRGPELARLPGTRVEVETLARLVPGCTTLLGSAASEQRLYRLASSGQLKKFRLIHLGTHGLIDLENPERSYLALARDRLPRVAENAAAASKGERVFTGELSVKSIVAEWDLDADLVAFSACQTAVGRVAGGDGHLGFAQALLRKGARSVLLSRWEVEDTATTLLLGRFYQNLLGKRPGLKTPLKRAAALEEAKRWLSGLERKEALALLSRLTQGVVRGPIVSRSRLVEQALAKNDRPYADPFFWAAFVLIGDPD